MVSREVLSERARTSAANRQCPMCDRKGALGKEWGPVRSSPRGAFSLMRRTCRFCGFNLDYERPTEPPATEHAPEETP